MKNILVPIGTSQTSHETLQYAIDFAVEFSANVFVMDVFSASSKTGSLANITEKIAKSSKERLREVIDKTEAKNIDIKIATYNGDIVDGINQIDKELGLDLIILAPRSNDIKEELYLGRTSGKIIKRTDIPTLLVPKGSIKKDFKKILVAFKSGVIKRHRILDALDTIRKNQNSKVNLLLVKTPGYTDEDLRVNTALMDISSNLTLTENATTYLGVTEHFKSHEPDLLCVFRRKRGFFKKLWEKTTISKSEFFAPIPVLVLSVNNH
ncbi:universal stress protein [uncultured Maribacter sp.]|uniref:universal stress protein n=1 Tax=uncultured Maribacter sp. TaxID=431308 RepID=UPI0026099C65|nr:universal stress protein [uncultured Maribacter sp.]